MMYRHVMVTCGWFWIFYLQSGNCLENLALRKPAWSSSITPTREDISAADNGVAGTHGQNWGIGDCTHSDPADQSPWLVVDLLKRYSVHNTTIYNRQDCCANRLHDFVVEVFETNPTRCASAQGSVCKNYPGVFGSVETLVCDVPVLGRFVRIWKKTSTTPFTICEMEVYGKRPVCQPSGYITTPNQRLVSSAVTIISTSSQISCVMECELSGACVGVNFNSGSAACELLTRPEPTDKVTSHADWVYSGHDLC